MSTKTRIHSIALPRARLRGLAKRLLELAPLHINTQQLERPIKVVCISDTHNQQPELPPGDLLLHAGDLSEWGSFAEIQRQLSWISSQTHTYKVVIAGNHDVLFDQQFLDSHKKRFAIETSQTASDLDFGSVIYLQDSAKTLHFTELDRTCTIYGSPWTPKYVDSAFQYPRTSDIWSTTLPKDLDILLTHGPPYGHLDGGIHSGCHYLAQAIEERRPRLVVFGHIHVGYGKQRVRFDGLRRLYEDIERGWSGWEVVPAMILLLAWAIMSATLGPILGLRRADRWTELVNAAIVGVDQRPCNEAIMTYI